MTDLPNTAQESDVTPDSTPEPATPQGNNGGDSQGSTPDVIQLTPAQLKQRLERTEKSVLSGVLEALGVDSIDSLKATLDADRQRKEAEMSESEKLQSQLDAMKAQLESEKQRATELETARKNDKRDNGLLQQLGKAHDADKALLLLKAEQSENIDKLISEDGVFDSAEAQKLVDTFAKNNAYLFASGAPGSPSNVGGRTPAPKASELAKEGAREKARRSF